MAHFIGTYQNIAGDALSGYRVRVLNRDNNTIVTIFADNNNTPIASVSGINDHAITDDNGRYSLYADDNIYNIEFLTPTGDFVERILDIQIGNGNVNNTINDITDNIDNMIGVPLDDGDLGQFTGDIIDDNSSVKQALQSLETETELKQSNNTFTSIDDLAASPVTNVSATLVLGGRSGDWYFDDSDFSAAVTADTLEAIYIAPDSDDTGASGAWVRQYGGGVEPEFFGAVGDGVTDDSAAFQAMFDFIITQSNRTAQFKNQYFISNTTINDDYVRLIGFGRDVRIIVKSGTTGINWLGRFGDLSNIRFESEGTEGDGLGTNGIFWSDGSTGYNTVSNVFFSNFSGFGIRVTNPLSFSIRDSFFVACVIGISFAATGGSFGTTVFLDNVYVTSCGIGIDAQNLNRSRFNVIGEFCDIAINTVAGDITLDRCYFEKNVQYGVKALNTRIADVDTFSQNPAVDSVDISYNGAVLASNRGHYSRNSGRVTARSYDFLSSAAGTSPVRLTSTSQSGINNNTGLKYGEAAIALVRGKNLLQPAAWQSVTSSEFLGFNASEGGYEIRTGLNGVRGMRQTITLDNTKRYILDYAARVVLNSAGIVLQVGGMTVQNGVPFTPPVNGANEVRSFNSYGSGGVELYVQAFSVTEVLEDANAPAKTQDVLARTRRDREKIYLSAAPASGTWNIGEIVYNTVPAANGIWGWACTTAGSPGTWTPIRLPVQGAAVADATDAATVITQLNSLLARLRTQGVIAT